MVTGTTTLQDRVEQAAVDIGLTEGQGLAAFRTWALIGEIGHESARGSMPRATWYRHFKVLRAAGFRSPTLARPAWSRFGRNRWSCAR